MTVTLDDQVADPWQIIADLRRERDERTAERDEALAQRAALAEVLDAINHSSGDVRPVFEAILEKAHRLCGADVGTLAAYDGEHFRALATLGYPEQFVAVLRHPFRPNVYMQRLADGERVVHVPDQRALESGPDGEVTRAFLELTDLRTTLFVALRKDATLLGFISAHRHGVRPFSEKEIALLETFAAQAVIAMENARLLGELRRRTGELQESLEYQTATSDVLKVISRSAFDLQPVLDTLVETTARLCNADKAAVSQLHDGFFHVGATFGFPQEFRDLVARGPVAPGRGTLSGRAVLERRVLHVTDALEDREFTWHESQRAGEYRTMLAAPLFRDGVAIGAIFLARSRVEPFTERQIELVRTFADQAVIAIENTRLITETREALEQQTATAEVLQVINASPGDLAPVFGAMLEKAMRLCDAAFGWFWTYEGDRFQVTALRGAPPALVEFLRQPVRGFHAGTGVGRLLDGERVTIHLDMAAEEAYEAGDPLRRAIVDLGGARSAVTVALRRDETSLDAFTVYRHEVRPFTDKQIALLQNFAAQAVIAMENARLLTETREALEQQTATAEVLQVINGSPGDLAPVFDAMLEKAMRLCEAAFGTLASVGGEQVHIVAQRGVPAKLVEYLRKPYRAVPGTAMGQFSGGEEFLNVSDLNADPGALLTTPRRRAYAELGGARSILSVPLRKDETLLGALTVYRQEVRPFTDKQIALLQNFAAQAVIAMENARLITETREALEQQTAAAEVLQVINSSPGELAPVFDAMLDKAMRLCGGSFGELRTYDGERFRLAATHGVPAAYAEHYARGDLGIYGPGTGPARILAGERVIHIPDLIATEPYQRGDPDRIALVDLGGARAYLLVPLLKDRAVHGYIMIYRMEVGSFTDKQIALLQNFAAQAVIAMENARLITETREALKQQTATAEVLQVINSSPGDLAPVFEAMLDKALGLCGAAFGGLWTFDGECFPNAALRGVPPALGEYFREPLPALGVLGEIVRGEAIVQMADIAADEASQSGPPARRVLADLGGARTTVWVALRKEETLLGLISIYRQEVRPFTDKQIALLQNFAAQAVIAMENARLITETREALEQQTATAEVLQVINSSPGDLTPVFDAMLEKATVLCEASFGILMTYDGEVFQTVALRGAPAAYAEYLRKPIYPAPQNGLGRLLSGERLIHIEDTRADEAYRTGDPLRVATADLGGSRTHLVVPLLKDNTLLGVIVAYRQEVRPFSDKQIALLQNFAAQAVIAMENARLITEMREALDQQTATAEVLQVINSSPGDLAPVFEAMLEKAMRLCEAAFGLLTTYDGEAFRTAAHRGLPPRFAEYAESVKDWAGTHRRLSAGADLVHLRDAKDDEAYRTLPSRRAFVDLGGARTVLLVPLRKDGALLGSFSIYRQEVRPFTERQIALLQNFATQAVIAMENARLITETREALEQQTATAEVLQVINSSPDDLTPVFDTLVDTAARLCDTNIAGLAIRSGDAYRYVATRSLDPAWEAYVSGLSFIPGRGTITGRTLLERRVMHVADLAADPEHTVPEIVTLGGIRTFLGVPLLREGEPIGVLALGRQHVEPFTERQIALVNTFAAQAVIAMENARLIAETREALDRQTATAEILEVINRSPGDLSPVFDAILEKAHSLCGAAHGILATYDGEHARAIAMHGVSEPLAGLLRQPFRPLPNSPHARLVREHRVIHIPDLAAEALWERDDPKRIASAEGGVRTLLFVPLRKDDILLGWITANRLEVRPFSDKEITLLESFASQAVIAMDNARLLDEIRRRQAELRVTFDNMGDGVVMFDGELHIAAWNRNFQEMLDLPDALLVERPSYADYVRILAERGEFGTGDIEAELSFRLGHTDQELRFERTRPDGRIIEVRRNAVPGGGFVLIYGDITERKRAEEEIRAARDTAETALRELKAAQANLIHAEKMASLGQLTAGIAHEIKNPLNFVNNFADLSVELLGELKQTAAPAVDSLGDDTRAEIDEIVGMLTSNLEKIGEHGRRADGIVKSMLEHSRGVTGERREVDLNGLIEEALNLAYHGARAQDASFNITLERAFDRALAPIELAPQEMTRVFLNLIGNGFYATVKRQRDGAEAGFRPTLTVATRDLGDAIEVRIRDNGTGVAPEIKDKLFQPFFTTKPTGEGTGLGLSISYDIVTQQHGGTIEVNSEVGAFTEFTVRLPRARQSVTAGSAA